MKSLRLASSLHTCRERAEELVVYARHPGFLTVNRRRSRLLVETVSAMRKEPWTSDSPWQERRQRCASSGSSGMDGVCRSGWQEMSGSDSPQPEPESGPEGMGHPLTRRDLLRGTAALGVAAGLGGLLAACGGTSSQVGAGSTQGAASGSGETTPTAGTTVAAGQPKRGGVLRIASVGGGKGETFDPARSAALIDCSRSYNFSTRWCG